MGIRGPVQTKFGQTHDRFNLNGSVQFSQYFCETHPVYRSVSHPFKFFFFFLELLFSCFWRMSYLIPYFILVVNYQQLTQIVSSFTTLSFLYRKCTAMTKIKSSKLHVLKKIRSQYYIKYIYLRLKFSNTLHNKD